MMRAPALVAMLALAGLAAGCSQGGDEVRVNVTNDGTTPTATTTAPPSGPTANGSCASSSPRACSSP